MQRILNLADRAEYIPVAATPDGGIEFEADLPAGIHRVSAMLDGRQFDWERLYFPMERYGNTGQRTGP